MAPSKPHKDAHAQGQQIYLNVIDKDCPECGLYMM